MARSLPRLALTLGDAAGIGPELVLRALRDPSLSTLCRLLVYGNIRVLERVSLATGLPFPSGAEVVPALERHAIVSRLRDGHVVVDTPFNEAETLEPGKLHPACGLLALECIKLAVGDIQRGYADALVTGPINKEAMHLAGVDYPGHTELLADLTQSQHPPCMAFHAPDLMVSLATIHNSLLSVSSLLSVAKISRTIMLTHDACIRLHAVQPQIGVLALNPHGGENGLFGGEEQDIIIPAIELARQNGVSAEGPLVPDTAFTWIRHGEPAPYGAYVAMYHDQGLIPFKIHAFDSGVNLTLGLPIVRTSPDHGTAFAIAWQGKASATSLFNAIRLAARLFQAGE